MKMIGTKYSWMTDDELASLLNSKELSDIPEAVEELKLRLIDALLQQPKPE